MTVATAPGRRTDARSLHYATWIRMRGIVAAQVRRPVRSRAMIVFMISEVPP